MKTIINTIIYNLTYIILLTSLTTILTHGQNSCIPSAANDKIFVGSATLTPNMLKPGVNTFSAVSGIIESQVPSSSVYDQSKLQIAHCFRNFVSSLPNGGYQMRDFSFHSILVNANQIKFLFLWNELSSINITISLNVQFLIIYDRQQFLMGSFVIDPVQFLLNNLNTNETTYSRSLKFKNFSSLTTIPNQNSSIAVNLFIVGLRYLNIGVNIRIENEIYQQNSSQLSFSIVRNTSVTGLYLLHISYVIFDKTYLSTQFNNFYSWTALQNQSKIDYWMKGVKQINFKQFQSGSVQYSQFYFYKFNRLKCTQGCSGCITSDYCQQIKGINVNDSECVVCSNGYTFNFQTLKCDYQSSCNTNQTWNGTQCICNQGLVRVNSICTQCPQNTIYNSNSQQCTIKCDQNQTLSTINQCICKSSFYLIDGKCSKCLTNYYYDSINKKCLLTCSAVQVYNPVSQLCECISEFYKINGLCGKCSTGYVYDNVTQTCLFKCGANQTFTNGKCQCIDGFVVIYGSCSKCPTGTIYNSLLQYCTATCTGNRKILNGKCVCNDGTYQIGTQCGTCPTGTTYNNTTKYCQSLSCKLNQVIVDETCYCLGSYNSGICQPCSNNFVWNATTKQCILNCPSNSVYNSSYKACICNSGFYVIGETCDVCPTGKVYDFATKSCQNGQTCTGLHQVYYLGLCICDVGYLRIKNNCSVCPSGSVYNDTIFDCQLVCGQNQIYNSSSLACQCNEAANYYKINGACQLCQAGTSYNKSSLKCQNICPSGQVYSNEKCNCPTGYSLIGSICGICDTGTIYNALTLKCDKACPDFNGYYQNGKCYCYPPYIVVNLTICQQCPSGTSYDIATLACKSTIPSNTNVTCNTTTQIKTLNTTSGLYYCACDSANKYYYIYDRCGTCQVFTKYNPDTKSCQLDTNFLTANSIYYFGNVSPISVGTTNTNSTCLAKDNKVWVNSDCKCISTAIKLASYCVICPLNSIPNSLQTSCTCKTGYQLLSNYTCKIINATQQSTIQCLQNQVFNQSVCVCVQNYYKINGTCTKCPTFSTFNGSTCICQYGYYAQAFNSLLMPTTCLKCHTSCSSCSGQMSSQCLSCVNISSILSNGYCFQQACSIGYYYRNYSSTTGKCQKCSGYCKQCVSSIQCKQCIDGFSLYTHNLTQTLSVKICSEICGDGKRFERNCDDGNNASGDGCDKNCQVQSGWACVGGTTTSKDICSPIIPTPKAIISIMNATIQKGLITQNIRISYMPQYFLKTQCSLCSNLFKINITQGKILPDSIKTAYIQKSKYQFSIEFKFSDIFTIPVFKFGVQLNSEYQQYFTEWDMAQWYEVQINSVLLSKKSQISYLRVDEAQ